MAEGDGGMRQLYSNRENYDMFVVYIQCQENSREAALQYRLRYPGRRHPHNDYFHRLATTLQRTGSFNAPRRLGNRRMAPALVNAVRDNVSLNPHTSTRAVGRDLGITHTKAHRVLKKYLKWRPWKRRTVQKLQEVDLPRRREFAEWIVDQVGAADPAINAYLKRIFWTDECSFSSNGVIHRRNEHHYSEVNPHCRKITHSQGHFTVNVWGAVIGDRVIGPVFLRERVTAASYTNFLRGQLQDIIDDLPLEVARDLIFQQDGHPAHTSNMAVNELNRLFNFWIGARGPRDWPARSPDWSVMDFFVWGHVKSLVYLNPPQTREEMEDGIVQAFRSITPEILANSRRSFMRRIALGLEQGGGHVEHLL